MTAAGRRRPRDAGRREPGGSLEPARDLGGAAGRRGGGVGRLRVLPAGCRAIRPAGAAPVLSDKASSGNTLMKWAELVDAAVIGTARAPAGEPVWPGQLVIEYADAQTGLLDFAAVTSRARRAGYRPPRAEDIEAPAPAERDERAEAGQA